MKGRGGKEHETMAKTTFIKTPQRAACSIPELPGLTAEPEKQFTPKQKTPGKRIFKPAGCGLVFGWYI